ncbi:MAG: N-acetyl-alpha-D-glucosaminyl L-malate synthase BshA [Bacteroidetes bacterium]|nr:N-acetyl-alpha-D-glucosaminyl L-malate synthase BshA [Bacteroidota bacterium]
MKIGIVCYPTYGGSGVMATELGKALANKGHQVHFFSYAIPVRLDMVSRNIFFHEVSVLAYPLFEYPPYELALISRLVDVIKYEKLDVLHVHYAIPHAFAAYSAKKMLREQGIRIPVVTTLHGTDITLVGKDPAYEPVVTFSMNKSDAVTAVSQFLKEETHRFFKLNKEIKMIPNFVDFERFSKQPKEHFKMAIAPFGEKIIMHTSNFRPVKRIDHVIEVFRRIREKMPSKLLLIGDGPERSNAEQLCRTLDICDDVRFLGKIDAVEELLSVADLFLMPSENESFGLAALEAMACEVPVVSTNAEGIPEVNVDGITGFTCNVGDVEGMAEKSIMILSDDVLHKKMKQAAFKKAHEFSLDKIMGMYEDVYDEVIKNQKARLSKSA